MHTLQATLPAESVCLTANNIHTDIVAFTCRLLTFINLTILTCSCFLIILKRDDIIIMLAILLLPYSCYIYLRGDRLLSILMSSTTRSLCEDLCSDDNIWMCHHDNIWMWIAPMKSRIQIHCPVKGLLYHLPNGPKYTFDVMFILLGVPTTDSMLPVKTFAALQAVLHSASSLKLHRKNKNCSMVVNPGAHTLCRQLEE